MKHTALKQGPGPARRSPLRSGPGPVRKTPLRKVRKGSTIKSLDGMLRQIVLVRDVTCKLAGAGMGRCGGSLQVSHIYPKGTYPSMRYRLENVDLACFRHHSPKSSASWHAHPMHYSKWFERTQPERARKLELIAAFPGKVDRKLDRLFLQAEAARLGIKLVDHYHGT